MVDCGTDKTAQEEEVGSMDLYAIEARFFGPDGGIDELPDYILYLIGSHIIWFDSHKASFDFPIVCSKGKLCDHRDSFCVDDIRQFFILWNEGVITQPHHAAIVVVMQRDAGTACNDGTDSAFCQFFVYFVCCFWHAAIGVGNAYPGSGADEAIF